MGAIWGAIWAVWGAIGENLGSQLASLGPSLDLVGPSWYLFGNLGPPGAHFQASEDQFGSLGGQFGTLLGIIFKLPND